MKKCTNCQADILDEALFCGACGTKQVASKAIKFCSKCGAEMGVDDSFCGACGWSQNSTAVDDTTKKPIPMIVWYGIATAVIGLGMAFFVSSILSDEPQRPSPVATKELNLSKKETNTTEANTTALEVNKTIVPNEIVVTKSSLLNRGNIKAFMQNYLQTTCFDSVSDVDLFFSKNMSQYFSFKNPTHTSIYNENVSYCQKWAVMDYQLDSFEIKNNNARSGNEIDIVANISYHVENDTKDIYSKAVMPITLVDEFGEIKIKKINSKTTTKSATKTNNYINPKQDKLAKEAYEMITGERFVNSANIRITKNSNNDKIYCVDGVCKTETEVLEYINN